MSEKTFAKLADQFDDLAAVLTAISGTFRAAGGGGAEDGADAPPVKKVRGSKPAAKSAPKEEAGPDEDTVREKLKELADVKGAATMKAALAAVGAGRLSEVEAEQYEELIAEADRLLAEEDEPGKKTPAKKGKAKAPDPVDFDEMAVAFKKLVKQDSATAKKVLKANGIAKLSEVDQDDEDAMQELNSAINAALEDEDLVG
jgi:nitrogen fixation-related uncharacterized protein